MKPKLSIIIPCYNCDKTLEEAVKSCYSQGFTENEFEIVMVDDGSSDNTKMVMQELAKIHANISLYYHTENKGGGTTRNTAVEKSEAEVIFCLDSDDILPKDTLKPMLTLLHDKKCDGVCFNFSKKFKGVDINDIVHIDTFSFGDKPVPFVSLLQLDNKLSPVVVVFMYTKKAFLKIGGYPTYHGFDTQGFGWRFLSAGFKVYVCPNATYLHRIQFSESYYLREFSAGKSNYNMKAILLEHLSLFSDEAQASIKSFDCSDFTRDILYELKLTGNILIPNYEIKLGTLNYSNINYVGKYKPIPIHSVRGLWLRIKVRLNKIFK